MCTKSTVCKIYSHISYSQVVVIYAVFLFLLPATLALAQKEVSYLLFGMPQRTFMYGKPDTKNSAIIAMTYHPDDTRDITKKKSYNFAAGFFIIKPFSKRIALRMGFILASHEQKYSVYRIYQQAYVEDAIRLKYCKFPICFQYNYLVIKKLCLFSALGPELNMLIAENGSIPVFGVNKYFPGFDLVDPGGAYRNFTLGGMIQMGSEIRLDDRISFVLAGLMDATFTPVERKSFVHMNHGYINKIFADPNVTIRTKNNIAMGVLVGLMFKIR